MRQRQKQKYPHFAPLERKPLKEIFKWNRGKVDLNA